uniref:Transmembrane protein 164-like n=1 Tax=Crassostrea virginica TaxID=6565 RepID=A0A8B8A8U8_CRAVI|nr:transmembrane protein 164-like [Crassostrea virginica]XP_022287886.1 transmembrane protein 164-like [Crassostrea virginica]XP_022287887.1 transmembrane protein 164-like [Crassostrea virginica]XP_022287888.1 transmembrane protein 164-like [Crassostrea virginica]XP_022287889.1 transmembrane protein 164-like [Crassostrea virginica]
METTENITGLFAWAYSGVNFDLAGNGGIECRDFISVKQRIVETLVSCAAAGIILYSAITHLTLPKNPVLKPDPVGKQILLVVHCLIFGIELGFKLATKQMIYILNPCHVATMMQIFCLAAPPGRLTTVVFRLHLHMLTGAPIAILFPVINTRLLPFETEVYYIQHLLMLVIPFYLLKVGGSYTAEPVLDFSWALVSMGVLYIIYFVPVQYLAYISLVNLNNMLCPAVSDPFYGPYYRICAMTHQGLLIPTLGKFYTWLSQKCLSPAVREEEASVFDIDWNSGPPVVDNLSGKNGVIDRREHHPNNGHLKSS